jgi:hypothetical protein
MHQEGAGRQRDRSRRKATYRAGDDPTGGEPRLADGRARGLGLAREAHGSDRMRVSRATKSDQRSLDRPKRLATCLIVGTFGSVCTGSAD